MGVSPVQVATFSRETGSDDLDSVIARHCAGYDLVITEGYKRGELPQDRGAQGGTEHQAPVRFWRDAGARHGY